MTSTSGTRTLLQPQIAFSSAAAAAAAQWPLTGAELPFFQVPSPGTALQSPYAGVEEGVSNST